MMNRALLVAISLLAVASLGCGGDDDHPSGIGNRCESDAECETEECYLGPGGGYCTSPCSVEGDTSECPRDTICKPIQGGPSRCLLICGSETSCFGADECEESHCPDGSSCVSVDDSSSLACEPAPN